MTPPPPRLTRNAVAPATQVVLNFGVEQGSKQGASATRLDPRQPSTVCKLLLERGSCVCNESHLMDDPLHPPSKNKATFWPWELVARSLLGCKPHMERREAMQPAPGPS